MLLTLIQNPSNDFEQSNLLKRAPVKKKMVNTFYAHYQFYAHAQVHEHT